MPTQTQGGPYEEDALRFAVDVMDYAMQLRIQRGWSQSKLAEMMGVSQKAVSYMERHPERLTVDRLYVLLRLLDPKATAPLHRLVNRNLADRKTHDNTKV